MKRRLRAVFLFISLYLSLQAIEVGAQQISGSRLAKITLIPDYVNGTILFDGEIDLDNPSRSLDLEGLPLNIEHQWKAKGSAVWNITGSIRDGKLLYEAESETYHLIFGPVYLQPNDSLRLIVPFVNLDYAQIQPPADDPSQTDVISRQLTNLFAYSTGDAGRDIPTLDIPFSPLVMKTDLNLIPLIGEALAGKASGLRLSGRVQFENIRDFDTFSRYCQITPERLRNGDTRVGHLLHNLDFPTHFGPDVLSPIYQNKPTRALLRSELEGCQYDKKKGVGEVQAVFSGRVVNYEQGKELFPLELQASDFPDGNYSFVPPVLFRGVPGYEIRLGRILLAPEDVLTISIPNVQVQADGLQPRPVAYENTEDLRIVYTGPASFELALPYVPQTDLYASQFPSMLRPSISIIENQLGNLYPFDRSRGTWLALGLGILLYLLSVFVLKAKWLSIAGWLLIALSLFYGVRGSFGLLCVTVLFFNTGAGIRGWISIEREDVRKLIRGLVGIGLIALGVYLDAEGTSLFRGLSGPELSPLTPLILLILVAALFLLFYGRPSAKSFLHSDLPILMLLLAVLSLYDAFDKSLLALLILFAGGWYVTNPSPRNNPAKRRQNEKMLGNDLRRRWNRAFGNRLVPFAVLILMIFAIGNDLSSTYANEMQVLLPPLIAPLVIPLLVFVSVFLTFSSIALLFILVYPFLPFKTGYLKATVFALGLFLVFLFGIGTDDRLIVALPNILVGRVIYYLSVPMLIGVYLDIHEFMQKENKRRAAQGGEQKAINFQTASSLYFKDLQGIISTLVGIVSLVAPAVYAFLSSQPVIVTYFDLLEKLVLLPT